MYEALNIFYSQYEGRCRTITEKGSKNRNHRRWLRADVKETEKLAETIFEITLVSCDKKKKSLDNLESKRFYFSVSGYLSGLNKNYGFRTKNK